MEWPKDLSWLTQLFATLGIGGGSGWLTKKWIDKRQNDSIQALEARANSVEGRLSTVEKDLEVNTRFDKQNREDINKRLDRIELKQDNADEKLFKILEIVNSNK